MILYNVPTNIMVKAQPSETQNCHILGGDCDERRRTKRTELYVVYTVLLCNFEETNTILIIGGTKMKKLKTLLGVSFCIIFALVFTLSINFSSGAIAEDLTYEDFEILDGMYDVYTNSDYIYDVDTNTTSTTQKIQHYKSQLLKTTSNVFFQNGLLRATATSDDPITSKDQIIIFFYLEVKSIK